MSSEESNVPQGTGAPDGSADRRPSDHTTEHPVSADPTEQLGRVDETQRLDGLGADEHGAPPQGGDPYGAPSQHDDPYGAASPTASASYGWSEPQGPQNAQGPQDMRSPSASPSWGAAATGASGAATPPGTQAAQGPDPAIQGSAPAIPVSAPAARRRGPGWVGVAGLVMAGMLLSSGLTLGGVIAYDQVDGQGSRSAASSSSSSSTKTADASPVAQDGDTPNWESVSEKVSPSTVAISVSTASGQAEGTGVIYREDGTIITNNHVVSGAQKVEVSLTDGRTYSARVIGTDATTDLAAIKLEDPPDDLTPASFGDSDDVQVGEDVMAVGTPLGLENTVTTGIISAVHRPVTTQGEAVDGSDSTYSSALQTDAAINPGNSGGPLVDASGAVVGINSSIATFSQEGESSSSQSGSIGLGFAIPSDTVTLIVDQLIESGSAKHALLGVTAQDSSQDVSGASYRGALVRSIERGSGASDAGLKEGDLITQVDGVPVNGAAALTGMVRGLEVGSSHKLTIVRGQKEITKDVTLTEAG
ncbi:S1C family serine protease [Brachybacterium sp. ACRRE]|uniref:S1C family serine protease n=1 Tax=Brachybacterium sp. ACRRE TaxID=2918184 RepID=UPI001EF3BF2E|nr:trypsin-like peptidase domain-containing protein [Brachybacterium sp. ACRRE]MCG7309631.1 trypsin-like peptidase domain-containing protein [Brachybacterium sp. ACRRE]